MNASLVGTRKKWGFKKKNYIGRNELHRGYNLGGTRVHSVKLPPHSLQSTRWYKLCTRYARRRPRTLPPPVDKKQQQTADTVHGYSVKGTEERRRLQRSTEPTTIPIMQTNTIHAGRWRSPNGKSDSYPATMIFKVYIKFYFAQLLSRNEVELMIIINE